MRVNDVTGSFRRKQIFFLPQIPQDFHVIFFQLRVFFIGTHYEVQLFRIKVVQKHDKNRRLPGIWRSAEKD